MAIFKLHTPISEEDIRRLKVNDTIHITGNIFTARDEAHKRILEFLKEGKNCPSKPEAWRFSTVDQSRKRSMGDGG